MKVLSKLLNAVLVIGILCTLLAAVGSTITKEPVLLSVIRSNSMHPVWERGDMVIIENLQEKDTVHHGDIVFFKTTNGDLADKGWIAHRVIDGNTDKGFITKGDASKKPDQDSVGTGPIKREWIAGRALMIGDTPIVIPKIGYLSLWMEQLQGKSFLLPVFALILAILIGFGELKPGQKQRKKNKGMELQLIYILGGVVIAVIMGGTMLASGQKINLLYEVSKNGQGALMGSDVGILQVGDVVSQPLSELSNKGSFPSIGVLTTNDKQVKLSHSHVFLSKGQQIEATYTVHADHPGKYESSIRVGLFYPFLPLSFVYFLAQKSYWLALAAVSLVPGLPLMIYPFIDGKMRRKTMKVVRKRRRMLRRVLGG